MSLPASPLAIALEAVKENPDVGGGDSGAPLADATRPKPTDGGTEAPTAEKLDARMINAAAS